MVVFRRLARLVPDTLPNLTLAALDPMLPLRWAVEVTMIWVRWGEVPLFLLLPLLFPSASPLLAVLLALGLALGNAIVTWLARPPVGPSHLGLIGGLATALEWGTTLGLIALVAHRPMSHAPVGLLLLVPLAGLRYGWPGLLAAAAAALAGIGTLAVLHLYLLSAVPPAMVLRDGISWATFLALTLAVSGGLLAANRRWRYQEESRWQAERANLRRLECGLTFREWQLLGLLTDRTLTYDQIGARLGISADTVKTHVRRAGVKLGASGRVAISDATRQHGLLPAPLPSAGTLYPPSPNDTD